MNLSVEFGGQRLIFQEVLAFKFYVIAAEIAFLGNASVLVTVQVQ